MFTRHCIRYMLGYCRKTPAGKELPEPLTLLYKGERLTLHFDCQACQMTIQREAK